MAEEIRWVETPRCAACPAAPEIKRRMPCRGCPKPPAKPTAAPGGRQRLRLGMLARRDEQILRLHRQGLSLRQIGAVLGIPRATAYNAFKRLKKREGTAECRTTRSS